MNPTKTATHTSWIGAALATLGCASCFPLLGSLGASLGLGFLSQFEGILVTVLLPVCVVVAIFSTLAAWRRHRSTARLVTGLAGPLLALLAMYVFFAFTWGQFLLAAGVLLMAGVSVWGMFYPIQEKT
jgi:mercuric ion transport protein